MNKAIGVFDSGLGGLTAVKELMNIMPNENIIYFGDTGRVPYGTRGVDTIIKYSRQDVNFLKQFDLKMVVVACGTVSSVALDTLKKENDIPIIGVVEPTAMAAVKKTKNKRIGIIGTSGTINSGSYAKAIEKIDSSVKTFSMACPLFVPLVENNYIDNEATYIIAKDYLEPLKKEKIDTLILGCTHYPLIFKVISDIIGKDVELVNSGAETAIYTKQLLREGNMLNSGSKAEIQYYVSDNVPKFSSIASNFLDREITGEVKIIDIEKY